MSLEIANGLAKTGLKSTTKLHTNTFLDGKVEMAKFKLAKATINMPKEFITICFGRFLKTYCLNLDR